MLKVVKYPCAADMIAANRVADVLDQAMSNQLTAWEIDFLESVEFNVAFSEKQRVVVTRIAKKIGLI